MKRLIPILILLLCFSACGKQTDYRSISESDIHHMVYGAVDEERFVSLDKNEIEFILEISPDEYHEGWVWQDLGGATIDEIAFFIADEASADRLYQKLENYLSDCKAQKKEWLESYNPPEAQKLANGTLFRYGSCMGYAFLDDVEQTTLLDQLDDFYRSAQ